MISIIIISYSSPVNNYETSLGKDSFCQTGLVGKKKYAEKLQELNGYLI